MMRENEWYRIVGYINAVWPQRQFERETVQVWWPFMAGLPAERVLEAVEAAAPRSTHPPTLAELLAAVGAAPPDEPDAGDGWLDALADLRRLVARSGGIYADPVPTPDDPALARLVDAWGWQALCNLEPGNSTARAQFRDAYRACARLVAYERPADLTNGDEPAAIGRGGGDVERR